MVDKLLEKDEDIKLQENCNYIIKEGKYPNIRGVAVLTNKRFIIFKRSSALVSIISLVIMFPIIMIIGSIFELSMLAAALRGALIGLVTFGIINHLYKDHGKIITEPVLDLNLKNINMNKKEDNPKIIEITDKNNTCRFSTNKKELWIKKLNNK